ncbi:MAG: PhnD/SsuA/transferrin family substrate-binding protein [Verrucomicrobiales bacterium]|nr:PhnD/SsuA/transferrin family substrate-binding protein [Verrucomicrobiales bacterium]
MPRGRGRLPWSCFLVLDLWLAGGLLWWVGLGIRGQAAEDLTSILRIGFSSSMFAALNENDARAAVKLWGQTVAREYDVPADPQPLVLRNRAELRAALEGRAVDAFGMTVVEYDEIRQTAAADPVFAAVLGGRLTERYLLVANSDGPVKGPADLVGRRLIVHQGPPRLCLVGIWLESLLRDRIPAQASEIVRSAVSESRIARAVLPVFFGKADACVVSRNGFDSICEMNPQVAQRLRVVAESEDLIPIVFGIRREFRPPYWERLVRGLRELNSTPAGQQVLMIFQSERVVEVDAAALEPSFSLIARHRQFSATENSAGLGPTSSPPALEEGKQ